MEFERSFFRIYERTLGSPSCSKTISFCLATFSILSIITGAAFFYSQIQYVHYSTIISEALNNNIALNTSSTNATLIKGPAAVKPEDLILFLFAYSKSDAERISQKYYEYKARRNITHSYVHIDYTGSIIFKAYLYSQNFYVLLLPPDTKFSLPDLIIKIGLGLM